jgi:hypothetical protein
MPWSCPKCGVRIGAGAPTQPSAGTPYECPVCHLNLAFDPSTKKMAAATTAPADKRRNGRNTPRSKRA